MNVRILSFLFATVAFAGTVVAQDTPTNEELSRRMDLLAGQIEKMEMGAAGAEVGSQHGMGPAASKVYSTAEGMSFGGYGEMLYTGKDSGDELDFYRAIIYAGYRFDDNWVFNSEIEIEHVDEIFLEFAYVDYNNGEGFGYRAGHMLVPMGWINELHEPTTFWSANRPELERRILPSTWHENGMGVYGESGDLEWRVYLMNGFDADNFDLAGEGLRGGRQKGSQAAAENFAWTGRVDWTGVKGLTLGASFWNGDSNQDASSSTEFGTSIMDIHFQYDHGPLRVRGLFADASVENADQLATPSDSDNLDGWYVEAGYDLLAGRGDGSSLTPFVRMETMDYLVDTAADTAEDRMTYGLAWQPMDRVIFKADMTKVETASSKEDIIQIAVGYIF